VLPCLHAMRRLGEMPETDEAVRRYLWDELLPPVRLPSGGNLTRNASMPRRVESRNSLSTSDLSRNPRELASSSSPRNNR
jgi:hypothetical protein